MENNKKKSFITVYVSLFSALVCVIIIIILTYATFEKKDIYFESSGQAMNTLVLQTVYGNKAESISSNALKNINDLEALISLGNESSDIYKLNSNAGIQWVDMNPKTIELLSYSIEMAKKTSGTFDPSILSLIKAWNLYSDIPTVPSSKAIYYALEHVGYENIKINYDVNRAKIEDSECGIDLSPMYNGSACSIAIETYKHRNAPCGIITVGNSVGVFGTKPNKTDWRIAIKDPFVKSDQSASIAVLKVKSGFVSTKAIFDQKFKSGKKIYNKVINANTGSPVETDLVSVSVWHPNGMLSDLLAHTCFLLGKNKSRDLLNQYGAEAIFIDLNKTIIATDTLKDNLIILDDSYTLANFY